MPDGELNPYHSSLGTVWAVRNAMMEARCGELKEGLKYKIPGRRLFLRICSPFMVKFNGGKLGRHKL